MEDLEVLVEEGDLADEADLVVEVEVLEVEELGIKYCFKFYVLNVE